MNKSFRITLLIILILVPIIFYNYLNKREKKELPIIQRRSYTPQHTPKVALIFEGLGESLKDLKEIYSLEVPLSISVIPGLKFSKNIAHIAYRCGFSVLICLPLQPKGEDSFSEREYQFIKSDLSQGEIESLLRYYLNAIRIAIGVSTFKGSKATENAELMKLLVKAIKRRGLIFIDSHTSLNSVAYTIAKEEGLVCGISSGFLDDVNDPVIIEEKLDKFIALAKKKGKIIIIAHSQKQTFDVLFKKLPSLRKEVEFVPLKDYFQ